MGTRQRSADHKRDEHAGSEDHRNHRKWVDRNDTSDLRWNGADLGGGGALRARFLFGGTAQSGDRNSNCLGGREEKHLAAGAARRDEARAHWSGNRIGWRVSTSTSFRQPLPGFSRCLRLDFCTRLGPDGRRRRTGVLRSRAAGDALGSNGGPAIRMTSLECQKNTKDVLVL